MLNTIINTVIILTLLYTSYSLWKIGKRRKENSLLFKMISLFILIHIVIFPIIYVLIINNDPSSIEIDNKILSFEKEAKLKDLELSYNKKDIESQKLIIEDILENELETIKKSTYYWEDQTRSVFVEDEYDEDEEETGNEDLDNFISLEKYKLVLYEKYRQMVTDDFGRFIVINPKNGYQIFEISTLSFDSGVIDVLKENLTRLKSVEDKINGQLNIIKSNKFWSYKEVLPYTINILFTDSFKPKRKGAQIIHFLHNVVVAAFLLSFIVSLFQNYITKEDKNQSIEERLDRIEELLKEKE